MCVGLLGKNKKYALKFDFFGKENIVENRTKQYYYFNLKFIPSTATPFKGNNIIEPFLLSTS